jgi:endoglucanase
MMAHVNTSGVHIPLWLDSPATSIGWGQSSTYPNQEGTFFGNIFTPAPSGKMEAFYCNGPKWDKSVVPGRLGAYQSNAPYTNPFGKDAQCASNCTTAAAPNQNDGFASCKGYNTPVTVWRQNAPSFVVNQAYKICSQNSGKCLDLPTEGLYNNGTDLQQWTYAGTNNQKWLISATDGGYFKITNKQSGKAMDIWLGEQQDGARIVQWDYWAGINQNWAISPVGGGAFSIVGRHSSKALDVEDMSQANGAKVHQWYYEGNANQIWTITPVN